MQRKIKVKTNMPNPSQIFRGEHPWKQIIVCNDCEEQIKTTDEFVGYLPVIVGWKTTCAKCGKEEINYRRPRSDYDNDVTAATDPELAMEEAYDEAQGYL